MNDNTYSYPKSFKKLRACLQCHLVKTEEQFIQEGCENCGYGPDKVENIQKITPNFKGLIAVMNPKYSWCARWLHNNQKFPGFYCIDILSEKPEENDEYEKEAKYDEDSF